MFPCRGIVGGGGGERRCERVKAGPMAIRGNNGSVAIFISKFIKQGAPEVRGRGKWSRKGVGRRIYR